MTDVLSRKQRSFCMSQIRGKNTKAEVMLRKALWASDMRGYRVHHGVYGNPDIAFTKSMVAVFVDGCFWHKCPKCFVQPERNADFWRKKLDGNVRRDKKVTKKLESEGWSVIRLWEHQIKLDVGSCVEKIKKEIEGAW